MVPESTYGAFSAAGKFPMLEIKTKLKTNKILMLFFNKILFLSFFDLLGSWAFLWVLKNNHLLSSLMALPNFPGTIL